MTDRDIVERAQELMGAKSIYIKPAKGNHKEAYQTVVAGYRAIEVAKLVLPFMGERRTKRIKELLEWEPVRQQYDKHNEVLVECGHTDRPLHARRMCLECYNKDRKIRGHFAIMGLDL